MIELLIATQNQGKRKELQNLFSQSRIDIKVYCLSDFGIDGDCPEDGQTFMENAIFKSLYYGKYRPGFYIIGDDSGLVVDVLGGEPGVYSARYAGVGAGDQKNTEKLLDALKEKENRRARFVTAICLSKGGQVIETFSGEAEGVIIDEKRGTNGFGYDPVFYYPPLQKTFAQLTTEEKNSVSHRARAFRKLEAYLLERMQTKNL